MSQSRHSSCERLISPYRTAVIENLRELPHAPGVQMRSVPSKRLSQALGFSKDGYESEPEDELDARLKSEFIWDLIGGVSDSLLRNHENTEEQCILRSRIRFR